MLYKARNEAIKFYDDYSFRCQKQRVKQNKMRQILIPKQMLQRLPIALAEVKAGNNSENLLNEKR